MEELGGEYFDELLDRSFLQPSKNKDFFKVHDLIFDLIVFISKEEFITLKIEDDNQNKIIPNNVRHLALRDQNLIVHQAFFADLSLNKHLTLRSILFHGQNFFYDFRFSNSMQLRTLHLNFLHFVPTTLMFLDSIASLKHLRYLYIGMGRQCCEEDAFSGILNKFCRLHNLRVLDLSDCELHFKLQVSTKNLINLHHLILPPHSTIACGISKLTSLQTLKYFVVKGGSDECVGLSEIEDLANLTGNCRISKLCNATNVESIMKANINKKQHIRRLYLFWNDKYVCSDSFDVDIYFCRHSYERQKEESRELAEAILEALRPHNNLKVFELYGYPGIRFPLWLGDPSYSKLQDLTLCGCEEWDGSCGVLDRGLPCLKKISIIDCRELKQLKIVQSSSLKEFLVEDCPKLLTLHGLQHLRSLKELTLQRCLKLQLSLDGQLPTTPAVVKVTDCLGVIEWCQRYGFEYFQELFKMEEWAIRHINGFGFYLEPGDVSLTALHICNYDEDFIEDEWIPFRLNSLFLKSCRRLRLLPPYQNLSTLRQLKIWDCRDLEYLQGLQLMESLESLEIINCPELNFSLVQRLPSKLQYLLIGECPRLMWLPGLQQLLCLRDLKLYDCRQLMLLPLEQLPYMHQVILEIINCPKLGEWYQRYKLSHKKEECLFARSSQQIKEATARLENLCVLDYDEAIIETENWHAFRLSRFYVCSCVHLKSITFGDNFNRLKQLRIWNCCHLEELYGLYSLASLQHLDISNCLNLKGLCPHKNLQSFQKRKSSAKLRSRAPGCFFKISKCPKLYLNYVFDEYLNHWDFVEIHACPQLQEWCKNLPAHYFKD